MTLPAENTISPFEIVDAREAAHKASDLQRGVEDQIRDASKALAEAERQYRLALAADLRYARDVAKGVLEAAQQQAFRYGADRRDLHRLIEWSQRRDLRTDAPPERWPQPEGAGVPPNVDPHTGELRAA